MSQRVKRPNRSEDGSLPVKRRKRTAAEEEEAASLAAAWQPPRSQDLKTIYNRTTTEAPAELFRKDLISAMKLPDSEPLALNEYWVIVDQWKQEWERGVQVPVNPDSLPEPSVKECSHPKSLHDFKLPKNKYIRITNDDNFDPEKHALSTAPAQSEAACSYDLDESDHAWLRLLNGERALSALPALHPDQLERCIEQLELVCWNKIQSILRCEEGLGIEYDENVICDVCRSPDSEEGNEMVFCDACNICVHQACYGITKIPAGQWLCCTCQLGKRPKCVLCPNKGGAMKCTRSGVKWAHVSCALWIPEVSIGCVERMEPITKVSSIPASRWALICVLCRERVGACIQCSVKTCKTAYHVTCAFKHGLEMRAIIEDENADDGVKLRSYCEKHSKSGKKSEKSAYSGSEDEDHRRKKRKDMTSEEKNQARALRLQEIEAEFYKHVQVKDITYHEVDTDALAYIYNYWKLKRKAGHNRPLLPPKSEDNDILSHKREQADLEKMKMFVQLRQDLERVRNLCYMVSRREKLSRSFFRLREQTFHKQSSVLSATNSAVIVDAVIEANHGPSIYDRLYSHALAKDHDDFSKILTLIDPKGDEKCEIVNNGRVKGKANPYKKVYFNGTSKRRSDSFYTESSSDEMKENRCRHSTDDECDRNNDKRKNNNNNRRHNKKLESSDEDDEKNWVRFTSSHSRLKQVEKELGYSGSDSDDLIPVKTTKKLQDSSKIYSDSDSSEHSNALNKLRTKAAVKEFTHKPSTSKIELEANISSKKKASPKKKNKKDYVGSDLIVPQRQAAKKATENLIKTTNNTVKKVDEETLPKSEPKTTPSTKPKKVANNNKESSNSKKDTPKSDLEVENLLPYVPQRQAAKKAAEHIKSGLGKPIETANNDDKKPEQPKTTPNKTPVRRKSSSTTSSSSSSTSSSDSSSSSSSDSESTPKKAEATVAPNLDKIAKDWPFLDKVAKPAASSSSSSDSSSRPASPRQQKIKKTPARNTRPEVGKTSGEQLGNCDERSGAQLESGHNESGGKGESKHNDGKNRSKLQFAVGKSAEKKEKLEPDDIVSNLEKEILERKASGKQSAYKTKLDKLFGAPPEPKPKLVKAKSTVKENKEPEITTTTTPIKSPKKSPSKSLKIDEIFAQKSAISNETNIEPKEEEVVIVKEIEPIKLNDEESILDMKNKQFQSSRSIFSPLHHLKDNLLDFELDDDGFGITSKDEEIIKGPLMFSFGNSSLFKEDSKEDSARETLNLVEKLRMELSKKSTSCDVDDGASVSSSTKNENHDFSMEQVVPNSIPEQPNKEVQPKIEEEPPPPPPPPPKNEVYAPNCENLNQTQQHCVQGQGDERWVPPSELPYIDPPHFLPQYVTNLANNKLLEKSALRLATPTIEASPSPYELHPQAKWADSEIMPNRRSSSSSAASTSSSGSRRNEENDDMRHDMIIVNHPTLDQLTYLPTYPNPSLIPPTYSDNFAITPVSLFPPPNLAQTLQFPPPPPPAPNSAVFPQPFGASFPLPPKPLDELTNTPTFPCTAAFTSSQHNMAFTAAMVNLQTKEIEGEPEMIMTTTTTPVSETASVQPSPNHSIKSNSSGKKSPNKPTRTSARVTNQLQKSPSKSPRDVNEPAVVKKGANRRGVVKGAKVSRGRGRGRGRGRPFIDYDANNTIHNKLIGTVYDLDFDDDVDNMADLKSMRERRKSVEISRNNSDASIKTNESPKFASPRFNADLIRDLRPPTPVQSPKTESLPIPDLIPNSFEIVAPVLPGPVDMRTYNSFDCSQVYNETNLLTAFAHGTTETQCHDEIDEDFEKELHSAITATSIKKLDDPAMTNVSNIKVSLSDSRNQLKVKIKGPIANYSAPLPPPAPAPLNHSINNIVPVSGGTSNLRRMRKKELLRQYCSQDMNMDEGACVLPYNTTPSVVPPRNIITIPKAVASMTSIPTKDDYRDYRTSCDDLNEAKANRKETKARAGMRELRQLDASLDEQGLMERRQSLGFDNAANKRRGRPPRSLSLNNTIPAALPVNNVPAATAPKIKIKFGGNNANSNPKIVDERRIRPPKKRLAAINMPSVEDLKRESMKFRKMVMADYGDEAGTSKKKKKKKDKSEKRAKRKKAKQQFNVEPQAQNSTKLIIRFGSGGAKNRTNDAESGEVVMNHKNNSEDSIKITPIKLKLSRCVEGYVMKSGKEEEVKKQDDEGGGGEVRPPLPPTQAPPTSTPLEVR